MNSNWIELVTILSVGIAVAVFCFVFFGRIQEFLEQSRSSAQSMPGGGLLAFARPLLSQLAVVLQRFPVFSGFIKTEALKIHPLLLRAGEPGELTAEEFVVLRLVGLATLPILVAFASGGHSPVLIIVGAIFGYIAPPFWLKSRINKRAQMIASELPDALDLVSLMASAGLDLGQAMEYYARGTRKTPLIDLFQVADKHMKLGRTRTESLLYMARTADIPELTQVISGLVQAERLGAPIGPFLAEQSADQRDLRFSRAEESGQKAPVKLLAPLLIFVVPGVFLVVFGPMALQYFTGQLTHS